RRQKAGSASWGSPEKGNPDSSHFCPRERWPRGQRCGRSERRLVAGVALGGGAGALADLGGFTDGELDFALAHHFALDLGVRADHHARIAAGAPVPAVRLVVADAAFDHRAVLEGEVAVDVLDVAADHGPGHVDAAVDRVDAAADAGA